MLSIECKSSGTFGILCSLQLSHGSVRRLGPPLLCMSYPQIRASVSEGSESIHTAGPPIPQRTGARVPLVTIRLWSTGTDQREIGPKDGDDPYDGHSNLQGYEEPEIWKRKIFGVCGDVSAAGFSLLYLDGTGYPPPRAHNPSQFLKLPCSRCHLPSGLFTDSSTLVKSDITCSTSMSSPAL